MEINILPSLNNGISSDLESDLRCLRSIRQGRLPTPPDEEQTAFRCDDVLGNLRSSVCH